MRELESQEINSVDGGIAPVLFVGAVMLSKVSVTNVAMYTGFMIGAGAVVIAETNQR